MDKKGAVISCVSGVAALGILTGCFLLNASPYVTVTEARKSDSDGLHVAGQVEPNSIVSDFSHHEVRFKLRDAEGQVLPIVYTGAPVSSLGTATKVVAIGAMKNGSLQSDQLLVKCPSKYESKPAVQ
ncbi:MAG TPA: cytochrome c maturation protein CcmE [Fimbriimonadaceae bacterium]|jgi:cytochrome c-type biogenesis protein CcmE